MKIVIKNIQYMGLSIESIESEVSLEEFSQYIEHFSKMLNTFEQAFKEAS